MKSLKLFNAVLKKKSSDKPVVDFNLGLVIEPNATWKEHEIKDYYSLQKLSGNDLNKSFYKNWKTVLESTREEILIDQILHYISTYGTDFEGDIYIPDGVIKLPKNKKLVFKTIKAYTKKQLREKALGMLCSGIALKEETIDDLIDLLDEFGHKFSSKDNIKNKEAIVKIATKFGIFPNNSVEMLRYVIYLATNQSMIIKSDDVIKSIKESNYNPEKDLEEFGLIKMSKIFNRFKPLFLAFKSKCPSTINRLSKLSKIYHEPMIENPLNKVTTSYLKGCDMKWLRGVSPFVLFKALSACRNRVLGADSFVYRIRNGKSWSVVEEKKPNIDLCNHNVEFIIEYLKNKYSFIGKTFFIPDNVEYALPTSEKMFVGNIPTGTKFYNDGPMAVGIYWENSWGARDLDLSSISINGKVGWNSDFVQGEGSLIYSGDMTNAPDGAVEYMRGDTTLNSPALIMNNVYRGNSNCEYKIVVGVGSGINKEFMMNPNKLMIEEKCQSMQKQTVIGMMVPEKRGTCFVILNFGAGNCNVSWRNSRSDIVREALYQQWSMPYTFNDLILLLDGEITTNKEKCDYDLSLDKLEKDTFTKLLVK
jgi:hypothetical protein